MLPKYPSREDLFAAEKCYTLLELYPPRMFPSWSAPGFFWSDLIDVQRSSNKSHLPSTKRPGGQSRILEIRCGLMKTENHLFQKLCGFSARSLRPFSGIDVGVDIAVAAGHDNFRMVF